MEINDNIHTDCHKLWKYKNTTMRPLQLYEDQENILFTFDENGYTIKIYTNLNGTVWWSLEYAWEWWTTIGFKVEIQQQKKTNDNDTTYYDLYLMINIQINKNIQQFLNNKSYLYCYKCIKIEMDRLFIPYPRQYTFNEIADESDVGDIYHDLQKFEQKQQLLNINVAIKMIKR